MNETQGKIEVNKMKDTMNTALHLRFNKGKLAPSEAEIYVNPIIDENTISPKCVTIEEIDYYVDLYISELEAIRKEARSKFNSDYTMNKDDPYFKLEMHSRAFLERAMNNLQEFKIKDDAEALFYAALNLRFGIEARLYEYIKSTLRKDKVAYEKVKDFSATKLLKKLCEINPKSSDPAVLRFGIEGTQVSSVMVFTPVTEKLAKYHGELGGLLHYTFFVRNKYWYRRDNLKDDHNFMSLMDWYEKLLKIADELAEATKGQMLSHPVFTSQLGRVLEEGVDS